jgi:hypothetical protein
VQDAAVVEAARLSHRYVSGRKLPDKAIDLMDEASSLLYIHHHFRHRVYICMCICIIMLSRSQSPVNDKHTPSHFLCLVLVNGRRTLHTNRRVRTCAWSSTPNPRSSIR